MPTPRPGKWRPVIGAIGVIAAIGVGLGIWQTTGGGGPTPPLPGNAAVFIDPVSGSDSGANCQRYTTAGGVPDPGGVVCKSISKAYTLATYGDTVLIRNGTFTAADTFAASNNKADNAGQHCDYILGNFNGCITFKPETGATVTFDVPLPTTGTVQSTMLTLSCATYLRLQNISFLERDITLSGQAVANEIVSHSAVTIGPGDSTCVPQGPPHDVIFDSMTVSGALSGTGGIYNSCVVNTHAVAVKNLPWHWAQGAFGNADPVTKLVPGANAHDDCMIGNTFDGFNFQNNGYSDKHMECVTMFSGAGSSVSGGNSMSNNVFRNNKFLDCPVEGLFMQIDYAAATGVGSVSVAITANNNLFEGNLFINNAGAQFSLKLSCHSSGGIVTNTIVRFNTWAGGGNTPWDNNATGGDGSGLPCTESGNVAYGNIGTGCPPSGQATSNHNVFAITSCATDNSTSSFSNTPAYVGAGNPTYNYALANCTQAAADFIVPASVAGFSTPDLTGQARPKPGSPNLDAGAYESCGVNTGGSLATCTGHAGTPADPCAAGTLSVVKTYTSDDGQGTNVSYNYYVYKPSGLTGAAPAMFVFSGDNDLTGINQGFDTAHGCSGQTGIGRDNCDWKKVADENRFIVIYVPDKLNGAYNFFWSNPQPFGNGNYVNYVEATAGTPNVPTAGQPCRIVNSGGSQISHCDDTVRIQTLYNNVVCTGASPCEGIDSARVFATGQSKGGQITQDLMCNPATSSLFRGYIVVSWLFFAQGTTSSASPACPMVLAGSPNRNFSFVLQQGSSDSSDTPSCSIGTTNCVDNGGVQTNGTWRYGIADNAQKVVNAALGCSNTPTTTPQGNTGQVSVSVYSGCTIGIRGVQTARYSGQGHAYPALGAFDGYDSLTQSWNFVAAH